LVAPRFHHALTGVVDGALRASNAQFEPPEVLERLGVKLLKASPGDRGWEVFSLDYKVGPPLSAVITPANLRSYRQVFHLLWRLKRGDFVLSKCWRQHMASAKARMTAALPALARHLHSSNLARNRMWHLIANLSNYMMFEVLEESWEALTTKLNAAATLNEVVAAHEAYLAAVQHKVSARCARGSGSPRHTGCTRPQK